MHLLHNTQPLGTNGKPHDKLVFERQIRAQPPGHPKHGAKVQEFHNHDSFQRHFCRNVAVISKMPFFELPKFLPVNISYVHAQGSPVLLQKLITGHN